MSRYIDADALDNRIKAEWAKQVDETKGAYGLAHFFVETQPTVDVAPVEHAHWEYHDSVSTGGWIIGVYVCSACKATVPEHIFGSYTVGFHKEFCGACGAKMDEEVKQ